MPQMVLNPTTQSLSENMEAGKTRREGKKAFQAI